MFRLLFIICLLGSLVACSDCQNCREQIKTYEVGLQGETLVKDTTATAGELCNEDLDAFSSEDSSVVVSGVFPGQTKTVTYFICEE